MPPSSPIAPPDTHVEMVGHATLRIHSGGKTLLTDPWLIDPICAGSCYHFPPLVHDLSKLARSTDAIHVSHDHPDHFHRPSLAAFPSAVPIYIGRYRKAGLHDAVRRLGLPVVELPFDEPTRIPGTAFELTLIEHDVRAGGYDSALIVRTPEFTLFENNDCQLRPETYERIRRRFAIDYAFLGYSPAGPFPIAFEMPEAEKTALLHQAAEQKYAAFLEAARILSARVTVPYANDLRYLAIEALWRNAAFSSDVEAVRRLRAAGLAGVVLRPGDRLGAGAAIASPTDAGATDGAGAHATIEAHARACRERIDTLQSRQPAPRADLVERFRDRVLGRWRRARARAPGISRPIIAYDLVGLDAARFYFDFTRADAEIFSSGTPPRYDMRYVYPAIVVQMALDGEVAWEELDFTSETSIHQIAYAAEYRAMLLDDDENAAGPRPA